MSRVPAEIYINAKPASSLWMESIQQITVDHHMGRSTEVQITFPLILDEKGNWSDMKGDAEIKSESRVRILVSLGEQENQKIFEGNVIRTEIKASSQPGESSSVMVAQDDLSQLKQDEKVWVFEDAIPLQALNNVLNDVKQKFSSIETEEESFFQSLAWQPLVHRGSRWQLIEKLAQIYGVHFFARPTRDSDLNKFYFVRSPLSKEQKKGLWVNGPDRNLEEVEILDDYRRVAEGAASSLNLFNKQMELNTQTSEKAVSVQRKMVSPGSVGHVNSRQVAQSLVMREERAVLVKGKIKPESYSDVLFPHSWVRVGGLGERLSGEYQVARVKHTFLGGRWEQEVGLRGFVPSQPNKKILGSSERIF